MKPLIAVVIALTASSCVFSHAVAIGPPQSPRGYGCAVQFSQVAPEDLAAKYSRVGSVCVSDTFGDVYADSRERGELQARACELGGELVTASGACSVSCGDSSCDGTEFTVMRARPTTR